MYRWRYTGRRRNYFVLLGWPHVVEILVCIGGDVQCDFAIILGRLVPSGGDPTTSLCREGFLFLPCNN